MIRKTGLFLAVLLALGLAPRAFAQAEIDPGFEQWLSEFKQHATAAGIAPGLVTQALDGVQMDQEVIDLDQKQPENKITLAKYVTNTINDRRIRIGREMMVEHHALLKKIAAKYHVQPAYIVALWGIESDYGTHQGDFSVIQSLATLAYEGRRRDFFSDELLAALRIVGNENMLPGELTGSWAGAMGNCQFMPSTYLKYAADGDGDGRRDIWNNPADVFASIANYLHELGWQDDRGWGEFVNFPEDFSESDANIAHSKSLFQWQKRGVTFDDRAALNGSEGALYAIYPGKQPEEGAMLVTDNFKAILQWNRSRYFATAVGILADKLGEKE